MNETDYNLQTKQLKEAGGQMATTTGIFQTVYFAAISFTNIKAILPNSQSWFYFVPIPIWLLTLVLCMLVVYPDQTLRSFTPAEKQRQRWWRGRKTLWAIASILFFAGLAWMVAAVTVYLFFLNPIPQTP